jgi:primase-polymerase (primpol)-like protein
MEQPQQHAHELTAVLSVPVQLRLFPQWVVWKYGELRSSGKREKKPYSPGTGTEAKANDSATWGSFDEAATAFQAGDWDGIGFFFSETDPFVFIDLDDCRDPQTGALTSLAEKTIQHVATYTEISPSGTGVHLILQGNLGRRNARRTKDCEVYNSGQFATITGAHLPGTTLGIEPRQKELTAWYDENFADSTPTPLGSQLQQQSGLADEDIVKLARAARGKNGARFRSLFDAGYTTSYASGSEADMALAGLLVFYTSDTQQIERLMRQSALARPKWDRAGNDYLERTIAAALAKRSATYRRKVRREEAIPYIYPWQQHTETPAERAAYPEPGAYATGHCTSAWNREDTHHCRTGTGLQHCLVCRAARYGRERDAGAFLPAYPALHRRHMPRLPHPQSDGRHGLQFLAAA